MRLYLIDASWQPWEFYKVYGGTMRRDCRIYRRETVDDKVGRPTDIVGPYDELEKIADELNRLVHPLDEGSK